jgi:hypothetical protein
MASNRIDDSGLILRDARTRYTTDQREENGAHGAFDAELRRSGRTPRTERLGLPEGADVLTINHIGTADGRVVEVTQHVLGKGWKLRYAAPLA